MALRFSNRLPFGARGFFATALAALVLQPPAPSRAEAPAGGEVPVYIRFLPDTRADDVGEARADRLQTAVTRFQRGADSVDLVAVVHLGDAAYFDALDALLDDYDRVLYEMVGGPVDERAPPGAAPGAGTAEETGRLAAQSPADPLLGAIGGLQQGAKQLLGLEFQVDAIDYQRPHFVHADLTWEEYRRLSAQSGQDLTTLFERALALAASGEAPGVGGAPASDLGSLLLMVRLAGAVSRGDSAELKRVLAPMLAGSGEFLARLEGEDGTLIVGERNRVALRRLEEERSGRPGGGRYAVFYGAGHMADLEARLLGEGYAKGATEWFDAWLMPRSAPAPGEESVKEFLESPADAAQRFLDGNPAILDAIQQMGTALQRLQEAAP